MVFINESQLRQQAQAQQAYWSANSNMPFKSKAQERFMFAKHPKIAKEFAKHTESIKSLPEKVHRTSAKSAASKLGY